jgi:hypothetical protein
LPTCWSHWDLFPPGQADRHCLMIAFAVGGGAWKIDELNRHAADP